LITAVLHAQQHGRDGRQRGTDDEGQGDDVVGVDAQQVGHLDVFGAGAAGAAQAGAGDEQGQAEHGHQGDHEHQDLHVGNQHFFRAAWPEGEAPGIRLGMDLSLESCDSKTVFCRKIDMPMAEISGIKRLLPRKGR
jgi:hypothetical protein